MPQAGPIVTDPKGGAYCRVTLDGGHKIIVHHDRAGSDAGLLTIETSRFMGFASDRILACRLDDPPGRALLTWLTRGAEPGSLAATPLGAAVAFVTDAGTLVELRRRCAVLASSLQPERPGASRGGGAGAAEGGPRGGEGPRISG